MTLWVALLVASVACFVLKLAGYLVPGSALAGERTSRVTTLLPVALLSALVVVQTVVGSAKLLRETGQFDVGVLLDLDKVVGLRGGAFQATVTYRRGRDLGADANLGVLQQVQEVYGRGQTVRLTQFWYEQKLGEKLELKIGRTNPGEDFASFSCYFQNLSFCGAPPGNLNGDYWQNWPVSQWGARLRYDVNDHLTLKTAAWVITGSVGLLSDAAESVVNLVAAVVALVTLPGVPSVITGSRNTVTGVFTLHVGDFRESQ